MSVARSTTTSDDGLPDELFPFKIRAALARTNGKPQLLRKLMIGFYKQYSGAATELRGFLNAGRTEEGQRLVHSLKSVAATLEASELAEASAMLEAALRSGQVRGLDAMIGLFEERLTVAITAASTLDRRAPEPRQTAHVADAKGKPADPRGLILIIDDASHIRDLMTDILEDEFRILTAASGPEGIEMAMSSRPDLVLLDINMPGMDGYEVLRLLQDNPLTARTSVIVVTGSGQSETETNVLNLGAVDYVTKPINPAVLRARVRNQERFRRAEAELLRLAAKQHFDEMAEEMERHAAAERNRELQLKMKDEFLSHVSHELRSPLAAIYAFITLIVDGHAGEVTKDQDEYLHIVLRNAAHLQSMIEDILQATALGTGKLSIQAGSAEVSEAIEYAMHTLQGAANAKSIVLAKQLDYGLRPAHADPVRLRQILTILLDNAVKFTPEGGLIRVEAALDPERDFLVVTVSDSGCGIRPEAIGSIFERLYQVALPELGSRGLGLGLHIAKELVVRQGGRIWVESEVGSGSTFCFTVPAHAPDVIQSLVA